MLTRGLRHSVAGTLLLDVEPRTHKAALRHAVSTVQAVLLNGVRLYLVNALPGSVELYLPLPDAMRDQIVIKKTDATGNVVIVRPQRSALIDGASAVVVTRRNQSLSLASDGANWWTI